MLRPILRSTIVFAAVVVAYQVYVLTALPVLEPTVVRKQQPDRNRDNRPAGNETVERFQRFLAHYFPADHWSVVQPCIVIESAPTAKQQMMLVLSDYKRHDDGRIDLAQCAVLILPTSRQEGLPPPRDAIILEAPQGARLQFDDHFDPTRGQIGRLVRGDFPGTITIRSDMHEPGPHDDLFITTSDLRLVESRIESAAEVKFRLGENRGGGKRLEIRLVKDPHAPGLQVSGVQSLEIFEQVHLSLKMDGLDLLSEETKGDRTVRAVPQRNLDRRVVPASTTGPTLGSPEGEPPASEAATWESGPPTQVRPAPQAKPASTPVAVPPSAAIPPVAKPPLEVICTGPFAFDFLNYKATFLKNVEISQLNLDGPSDQLSCQELNIYFAPLDEKGRPADSLNEPDVSRRQRADIGRLEPTMLEAIGNPVVVVSPVREAEARGQRLRLDVRRRRLKLDGGRVMLAIGPNEIHAPLLQYEHPAPSAASKVGRLWVAGPGWMRAVPKPDKPNETVEARWERVEGAEYSVRLTRKDGQPVLSIIGRPHISAAGFGTLTANTIHAYLNEIPADGDDGPALEIGSSRDGAKQMAVLPDRIAATGHVLIESPQFTGRTEELLAWFQSISPRKQPNASTVGNTNDQPPSEPLPGTKESATSYDIGAAKIQMEVALVGKQAQPRNITCDGQVIFRETSAVPSGEEPMVVRGEQVRVEDIHKGAKITVAGGGTGNDVTRGNATVSARGMNLAAEKIHLDQKANRLWIDGPGEADMIVTRDLLGQETAGGSYPVHIRWQGGLNFDGQTIELRDNVFAEGPQDWLNTKRLTAKLSHAIKFGEGADQPQKADIAEITCSEGVAINHRTVDAVGEPQSHERGQLHTLSINQTTGAISGNGPGWVRSVHFGKQAASMFGGPAAPAADNGTKLNYLRVDFLRGISGNIKSRTIVFQGHVRAIYGPVDAWQQELFANGPGGLPEGAITLESEELQVNEDPFAHRLAAAQPGAPAAGPFELKATGNVRIEGGDATQGRFNATAHSASYNQDKDVFILEGNGQLSAMLHLTGKDGITGAPAAGKITYYRQTGRVKVDNLRATPVTFPGQGGRQATRP